MNATSQSYQLVNQYFQFTFFENSVLNGVFISKLRKYLCLSCLIVLKCHFKGRITISCSQWSKVKKDS